MLFYQHEKKMESENITGEWLCPGIVVKVPPVNSRVPAPDVCVRARVCVAPHMVSCALCIWLSVLTTGNQQVFGKWKILWTKGRHPVSVRWKHC
jgi:hypothetical protein